MRSISDTIARLHPQPGARAGDQLTDMGESFDNPGALRARMYVPDDLAPGAALVVVLHGCTQNAAGYDYGSGWSAVADAHGFALLFPEQVRGNNPNLCFNWFLSGDTTRGSGEAASIRAMIAAMVDHHGIDPARIFVTGLSAGGAMAATMLATYPEVFAGGAIIAGLPHGVATSIPQALERMRGQGLPDPRLLARAVTDAAPRPDRWPTVSVWHGSADATVVPVTGEAVILQWLGVHGLADTPAQEDRIDGQAHRVWRDASGRIAVEAHVVAGMGHGTPLDTEGVGVGGAYMLDVGTSSTLRIAESWGLVPARSRVVSEGEAVPAKPAMAQTAAPATSFPVSSGVGKVIEDALRSAGLMR